jgi:hypothetical protein
VVKTALVRRVLFLVILLGAPARGLAQDRPVAEIEAGVGYSLGGGAEDPAPTIGTLTVGGTLWLTRSWGLSVAYVASYGSDLDDAPVESGDRVFEGLGDLRYLRTVLRHRRALTGAWMLDIGAGLVTGGSFDRLVLLRVPGGSVRADARVTWGGFAGEVYVRRSLGDHLALRAGATVESNFETTVFQPVVLGVVAF